MSGDDPLRAAWDDLIAELERARDAIDTPELMPPPASDRNLAEGYRYLMGFVHSAVERAFFDDPQRPFFRHALQLVNKGTIDNADAIYFFAGIDGSESYLIRGEAADTSHWRGGPAAASGAKAPQYVIFEASSGDLAGDSGSLNELRPGVKVRTGSIDSTEIEVDADGTFEILLAPERPPGYAGNFLATSRRARAAASQDPPRYATYVSGRQLFYDWQRERAVFLSIERSDPAEPLAAYDSIAAAAQLRRLGALVRGQMHFWNEFYTVLLETYGKTDGSEGERFMPRNAFNAVNAASAATGGGQSTNLYAGGVFDLAADEALVVESAVQVEPEYIGMVLSNLWGESLDFENHQTSLNGHQSELDADGVRRYVIAHRDPGVPNWLDTTGHSVGFMSPRWSYSVQPPKQQWPTIRARKVRFDHVRDAIHPRTRTVSPQERAERIAIRRRHVQRRYRSF